jgi:DNA-binding response OmpR family regulator
MGFRILVPEKDSVKDDRPARILVVDDEADIAFIIKKGLEKEGFKVEAKQDPKKALKEYEPGKYDLLLLDIRMPGMTGFELYKEIRKIDRKVKVCFITAFEIYFDEFKKVFPKIHVSCFIRKPVTISQLGKAIREELNRLVIEEDKPEELRMPSAKSRQQQHHQHQEEQTHSYRR